MQFVKNHADTVYERFARRTGGRPGTARCANPHTFFANPNPAALEEFFAVHKMRDEIARDRLVRLFEMERAAQAALTSCAWFFDDFGGLEGRVALRGRPRGRAGGRARRSSIEHETASASARNPFKSARDRRCRNALLESENARSTREGVDGRQ